MVVTKPPLGWNTWNTFGANINEQLILEAADAMVSSGLKDAGYEYVVIDDIWSLRERDENGRLVPNPEKFPHGMKYVADYIHAKGLKFGMYSCAGYETCAGFPGSYGYEWVDAQTFAEWDVDFLKYDFCYRPESVSPDVLYKRMGLALLNCGREILFSACSWGANKTRRWIKQTGANMWRSTGDIFDGWESVKMLAKSQIPYQEFNGQGCFNDMDMLIVGMNGKGNVGLKGCTFEEYKLHFSLWALLNSPLMIGCDIRDMSEETKQILLNREVIAVNQDPAARQPFLLNVEVDYANNGDPLPASYYESDALNFPQIAKFLDNGDIALGIFNMTDNELGSFTTAVHPDRLGLSVEAGKTFEITDLWSGETFRARNGMVPGCALPPHSCRMYRLKIVDAV